MVVKLQYSPYIIAKYCPFIANNLFIEKAWRPLGPIPGKYERLPLAVTWQYQLPTLHPKAAPVIDAQSWTVLFRAFSSHQQPSAYLTKGIAT